MQRVTGAQVKIPEDAATQDENEDTLVRIIGNFNASQVRLLLFSTGAGRDLPVYQNHRQTSKRVF